MTESLAEMVTRNMLARDQVSKLLDIEILEVGPGFAKVSMAIQNSMLNGFGITHGGITFALADTAFAYASNSRNQKTVAAGATIKFIKIVNLGDQLTATARERELNGVKGIYDITIENQDGATVAVFEGKSHSLLEPITEFSTDLAD